MTSALLTPVENNVCGATIESTHSFVELETTSRVQFMIHTSISAQMHRGTGSIKQ